MLELLVQRDGFAIEPAHFAIDANAAEALLLQVSEKLGELALSPHDHRSHHQRLRPLAQGEDFVGDLICRSGSDLSPAFGTVRDAHTRKKKAQIVIDFRDGSNRRTGILARRFLVDGHSWGKPVDAIDVGFAHLTEEHTSIARKALDVSTLAFSIYGVECER